MPFCYFLNILDSFLFSENDDFINNIANLEYFILLLTNRSDIIYALDKRFCNSLDILFMVVLVICENSTKS